MNLKPIKDQIIVQMQPEKTTPSGLVLPSDLQNKHEGIVIAVGKEVKHAKIGDRITKFVSVEGEKHYDSGIEYRILRESKHIEFVESNNN